jgi:hypothetical protein
MWLLKSRELHLHRPTYINQHYLALLTTCVYADFLLGLFFDPEVEGDEFIRNVS